MLDVIIIGAGPAGLFASYELSKKMKGILVIDSGPDLMDRKCPMITAGGPCRKCQVCNIMNGVGGAGLFSDGKLNLCARHGKTDLMEFISQESAESIISEIDDVLINYGAPKEHSHKNIEEMFILKDKARKFDIDLLVINQKHIGSDMLPLVIAGLKTYLMEKGVEFRLNTNVSDIIIDNGHYKGIKLKSGEIVESKYIIVAPGRIGSSWLKRVAAEHGIKYKHRGIEIGVRVEVPAKVMEPVTTIMWDPPFFMRDAFTTDVVRTFCMNPYGYVVQESYQGFNGVNGYAKKNQKSENTNFALLSDIDLTYPAEDTIAYGTQIGNLSMTIGGGKPFIQRLIDLKNHKRSYWERISKSQIKPTLSDVTPGDLSLALPARIVNNLLNALVKLDNVAPGINDDALLYGPELKFFSVKLLTDKNLQTNINNLYVAGDGAGVAGNIVGAAATGMIAAKGILQKLS
jgi:uncharacterized protein